MFLLLEFDMPLWLNFVHPILMLGLLALTLYASYLGYQHRQTRLATGPEKKELIKGKFLQRHHEAGSLILALMVLGAIGGMGATYLANGKLFVSPHLLAGLGMVGLIATSASLVPLMKKGNDTARYTHIGLNTVLVGMFAWQAVTGLQIVQRLLSSVFG